MDTAQWPPQEIGLMKQMEEMGANTGVKGSSERRPRPQEKLNCPRCNSNNTKFCYYNNYSLTQPRYFCKTCRRYWTEGGTLRNVPVGGGSRKNKRSTSTAPKVVPDHAPPSQNPKIPEPQDLNLGFPDYHPAAGVGDQNCSSSSATPSLSALDLLQTGVGSRGFNTFLPTAMPHSNPLFSTAFPWQELKPSLSFGSPNGGRLLFPLGEHKQYPNTPHVVETKARPDSNPYWNGMFGGRTTW